MFRTKRIAAALLCLAFAPVALAPAALAQAQQPAGSQAQRDALARLAFLDGEWRGTVTTHGPGGPVTLTQTERVGPLLGGSVRIIEGHGYDADGRTEFNALAIVAWDEAAGRYNFQTYANGYFGAYPFEVTEDGFKWASPAGPGAEIRYVAVIRDGQWNQTGDYVAEGQPPRRFIEMNLTRLRDSGWPAADPVPATP